MSGASGIHHRIWSKERPTARPPDGANETNGRTSGRPQTGEASNVRQCEAWRGFFFVCVLTACAFVARRYWTRRGLYQIQHTRHAARATYYSSHLKRRATCPPVCGVLVAWRSVGGQCVAVCVACAVCVARLASVWPFVACAWRVPCVVVRVACVHPLGGLHVRHTARKFAYWNTSRRLKILATCRLSRRSTLWLTCLRRVRGSFHTLRRTGCTRRRVAFFCRCS